MDLNDGGVSNYDVLSKNLFLSFLKFSETYTVSLALDVKRFDKAVLKLKVYIYMYIVNCYSKVFTILKGRHSVILATRSMVGLVIPLEKPTWLRFNP